VGGVFDYIEAYLDDIEEAHNSHEKHRSATQADFDAMAM
jgi:hypothetical protein